MQESSQLQHQAGTRPCDVPDVAIRAAKLTLSQAPASSSHHSQLPVPDTTNQRDAHQHPHAASSSSQATLQEQLATLRAELAAAQEREAAASTTCRAAVRRALDAEAAAKRLEAEADTLAKQVASLQEKLASGAFGKGSNTRVLHLRMNPESEYHRQAAAEKAVSTANKDDPATAELLSRVKELDTEVASLRKQQEDTHKVMARLKAVFKERTAVFREAIFRLFGYRVDMASEPTSTEGTVTTFSLRPQHADSPQDMLVFRYTPEGGMRLVPTPFTTQRLAREIDTFVTRFKCIPALTANLTMENFQRQTQA